MEVVTLKRRDVPVALLVASAGMAVTIPKPAVAQSASVNGTLLGPPLVLTGTGTYTPSAGAAAIYVVLIGGGGGSGGAQFTSVGSASGGSAAGGMCMKYITPLAASYAFSCGVGGGGGTAGPNDGSPGGVTSFSGTGIATLQAEGGGPSQGVGDGHPIGASASTGNGSSSNGDINLPQRPGTPGICINGYMLSGNGGSNPYAVGFAGVGYVTPGIPGTGFGAGASGALAGDTSVPGGEGSDGAILVWEYT